ncbi:XylR family transcriptional regulator [Thermosipho africanus H17ap60334]|nr:XylR family transcriptional regulator [Thermosipho africanus H17ap60334]
MEISTSQKILNELLISYKISRTELEKN